MASSCRRPLISILGDSISTFQGCNPDGFDVFYEGERCAATGVRRREDTWWQLTIDALGGELLSNGSFSGSMVEGAGFPAASSAERVQALGLDGKSPDIVIVFIGINDYGWGGASNQAMGGGRALPAAAPACEPGIAGRAAADAQERFSQAYGVMLYQVRSLYPHAQVWCCTLCPGRLAGSAAPTFIRRLRGIDVARYDEAVRIQAAAHGCKTIDLAAFGRDYEALDGTHPTALGMRQIAAMVLESMRRQGFEKALDSDKGALSLETVFEDDGLRAQDFCDRPDCLGCVHARSTGNAWSLVCEKNR